MEESGLTFTFVYRMPLQINAPDQVVEYLQINVTRAARLLYGIEITTEDEKTDGECFLKICSGQSLSELFSGIGLDSDYFRLITPE